MTEEQLVISYPRMGNYHILLETVLEKLFPNASILIPPPMTARTLDMGSRHSPENVCAPFKYNIGNFVEVLDKGANVLFQTGLGCIFGYYGELQERILKDLGYQFHFICFSHGRASMKKAYDTYRQIGGKCAFSTLAQVALYAITGMMAMDRFEYKMRENIAFETHPGSHEALHHQFLEELRKISLAKIPALWQRYRKKLDSIPLSKPHDRLRIGLVGELYTLMEPFTNFNLERELAQAGCSVSRKMSASFLTLPHKAKSMRESDGYLTRLPGATGADSVGQTVTYAKQGYDGVIHMKSFGCTPEINVTPVLNQVSRDLSIPILHLSFDTHTGEAGLQTRLEAFVDMLRMRKSGGVC